MNRYAEQMLQDASQPESDFTHYHRWKLYMDAPLAWLATTGRYHPRREVQRERLAELEGSKGLREWLGAGLERLQQIRQAMRSGPVDREQLHALQGDELEWSWPFFRAGLRVAIGEPESSEAASLAKAVQEGAPGKGDRELGIRWLQRRPLLARLRESRRWAQVGPSTGSSWISHARGGTGRDRVQLACALYFAGLDSWVDALRDLIPDGELKRRSAGGDQAEWLGGLWSDWVMGGSRS